MLSRDSLCVHEYQICTRAGDQIVLLKYQISGLGVTHAARERLQCCKKNSRKRESQSTLSHTNARAEGRRERKSSGFNHEEVQREFVSKLTRCSKLRFVKEWCYYLRRERERKHNCASPSEITFSPIGGSSFSSSPSSCARCFVPVFSRSHANSANDDDSPFCTSLSLLRYT